jgi:hypothetical protein
MVGLGAFLIILGIGSLLLPMFDIQFQLMRLVEDYQPIAGIAVAAIGAVLVLMGSRRTKTEVVVAPPPQEPPSAPTT